MAGLVGIAGARGSEDIARRFAIARDRMLRHDRLEASDWSAADGHCIVGHVRLRDRQAAGGVTRPAEARGSARNGVSAAFHGVLHNADALRQQLSLDSGSGSPEGLIAALYTRHGPGFVEALDGEFCLAIADPQHHKVLIATDPIGNYPLYWHVDGDGFAFASDLSALLRATGSRRRLNLPAVADYLTIGAVMGDKTLVEDVQLLGSGTILTYDTQGGRSSLHEYVSLATFFEPKARDKAQYYEAIGDAFTAAVRKAVKGPAIGLSLSGGLDSRAILSAVNGSAGDLTTYTLGVEGCADQVIGAELARIAGTRHWFFRLDDSYLRDFLPNMEAMVSITDGFYLSHGLTEMLALQFIDRTGMGIMLRGHGGELAKAHLAWPLHTDAHVHTLTSLDALVPYLSGRANYVTPGLSLSRIFTPGAAAAAGSGTLDSFAEALRGTRLSPAEACSYLYLRELNRRFTVPSLELFRTRVEVRLPYLDVGFLKALLGAPASWRDTTTIHQALTGAGSEAMLRVRNSNTGARADAGPLQEFVFDKLNTAFKRLNVAGYRHYHNFDRWMRKMLLETVERELLSPAARVQGFVSRAVLTDLMRETREGAADRGYLLQVLLILELWQRENNVEVAA